MLVHEKLLFAVHLGSVGSHNAGIIMSEHCLPIACSHSSWDGHGVPHVADGFCALWEATGNVEEFFELLGFGPGIESGMGSKEKPNGLYVFEVTYETGEVQDNECWTHLQDGELRRPLMAELEPLTRGEAPWGGAVL